MSSRNEAVMDAGVAELGCELPAVGRSTASSIGALSFRANFSWTFVGNVIYAGCQWGMLVVLAKLGSPEVVGQYALGLAVTAPVIMLSNLQLRGVLATDAREEHPFERYLTMRLLTTVVALVAIAGIVAIGRYQPRTALVILAVGLTKSFESLSDIAYGLMQHQEQMDRIAKSMIVRGCTAILAMWIGVFLTGNVLAGCLGVAAAWAAVFLLYDLRAVRASSGTRSTGTVGLERAQWSLLGHLALTALPLGAVMMLGSFNVNVPRYVVQHYFGERGLGIFAAVTYLMVAGTTVVAALGQSATPRLAQYYEDGAVPRFNALMQKLLSLGALLGAAGIGVSLVAGPLVLKTLFRPEYAAAANVLTWTMVAAAVGYVASFIGYGLTAARKFVIQAPLLVAVTASTGVASLVLVPRYGLVGAAWAAMVGAIVQVVGGGAVLLRVMETRSGVR